MRKIIFFILPLLLIFVVGCKNNVHIIRDTWFETKWTNEPKIIIQQTTWEILAENNTNIVTWEYGYYIDKESWRKFSYIHWYKYFYIYDSLWIKIETSWWYDTYSYQKATWLILKKYKNIVYNAKWHIWNDYIEVLYKNPEIPLIKEIQDKHLASWCNLSTGIFDKESAYFPSMIGFTVIYIEPIDYNYSCDKQFPDHTTPIIFIMDTKHPDKYYKLAILDWCAPWPCTIFWNIEFF